MAKDLNDNRTQDLLAVAKTTNADRQKAYREKQKRLENKRLNMTLDKDVADKLADMVDCFDDTQKAIMQRLIIKEYNRMYGVKNSKLKQYTENKGTKKA